MHQQHCSLVDGDTTGKLSTEYGVNSRSPMLDLEYFDMCCGTLIPDVMHDLLEGTLQHVLQLLLTYCIEEKGFFSLATLNEKIEGIELGYMETTRPAPVDHCKHMRQNGKYYYIACYNIIILIFYDCAIASQTWTLGRMLPLMVGCNVPENDCYWTHYGSLCEIMRYILAPNILPEEVAWLNVLIVDFLSDFIQLYPEASVIPKMHYMVHIPRLMIKLDIDIVFAYIY